jgi:ABC-type transport system substrate-binding protein/tetrahydromethanopterin S-methyltransferase subunit B
LGGKILRGKGFNSKSLLLITLVTISVTLYATLSINVASAQEAISYPKPYYPPYLRGPYVDRIVVRFITEGAILWELFKKGEITTSAIYPPGYSPPEEEWLAAAQADPGIQLALIRTPNNGYLGFNVKRWPTSELAVRRAIAHLIDYEYAITTIWKPGFVGPTWGYAPPLYQEWINPEVDVRTRYPYSLELAKKELIDAGWKFTDGKWISPDGREMGKLKYVCPGYSPPRIELGLKLKEDSEKIGIEWEVVYPPDWPSTERMTYIEKDFNLFANYATADPANPARWYFWAFHSSSYQPPGTSSINHFGIQDPELDSLIERLVKTMDINEAKSLVWKIQKLIEDKCYVLPLPTLYAIRTGVRIDQFRNWIGVKPAPEVSIIEPSGHETPDPLVLLNVKPVNREFGGTLVINRPFWPSSFNPLNWMEAPELSTFRLIYQPLAFRHLTPDGKDTVIPALAYDWKIEKWEISPGKFGLKYTFYLYDNITWHDGVPFTSEDVKFTYDLIARVRTASAPFAPVIPIYVKSETPDKYTVVIYTNDVGIFQLYDVISPLILPKHIWEGLPDPFAFQNDPPIGNGPFIWESYAPREYISLRANPRYHLSPRTLSASVVYKEDLKIAGDKAKFQIKLVGPEGETVTNGTVKMTLMKAGEEILTVQATHIGGGVYESTIDTGAIGAGDYIINVLAEYKTPLFTYQRPLRLTLTVLPVIYKDLIEAVDALKDKISTLENTISSLQSSLQSLQDKVNSLGGTVSSLAATSGLVTAAIGVGIVAIILSIVAIALSIRKR